MILIQLIIYLLARSTARSHSTELCMQYMRTIVCASCECVPFCVAAHGGRFVGVRALISFAIKPFGVPWLKSPIYQYKLTQLMDEIHSWCCRHRWQTECECTVRQTGVCGFGLEQNWSKECPFASSSHYWTDTMSASKLQLIQFKQSPRLRAHWRHLHFISFNIYGHIQLQIWFVWFIRSNAPTTHNSCICHFKIESNWKIHESPSCAVCRQSL